MNTLEEKYKFALLSAEKQFKYLQKVPTQQWASVNSQNSSEVNKVYTHEVDQVKTFKIVKELNTAETNLEHIFASLSTVEIRSTWCPLFEELQITEQPDTNTNIIHAKISAAYLQESTGRDIDLVEQTQKKRHHVEYISTSISTLDNFLLCFHIENRFDHACATIYYQWDKLHSTTLISNLLLNILAIKSFPWISQCDKAIKIQKSIYGGKNEYELNYTYTEQNYEDDTQKTAVDILSSKRYHHQRWHSGSWDQQQQQLPDQTLRKNNFLSSSSLIFSASPKLNPTARVMSSYPDKRSGMMSFASNNGDIDDDEEGEEMNTKLKDELRIEVNDIPQLNITLPDKDKWCNKFAQLCVRCYRRANNSNKSRYVIQILHPYKLMQYFKDDTVDEEETMKLDDEMDEEIHVKLILKTSPDNRFSVNDNEWPIRSWNLFTIDDTSNSTSEDENEEEEDIFVDGMENITEPSMIEQSLFTQLASELELPPPVLNKSLPEIQPEKETETTASLPPHPLEDENITNLSMDEQQQTLKEPIVFQRPKTDTVSLRKAKDKSSSNKVELPPDDIDYEEEVEETITVETILPDHDPVALQKIYPQFSQYINPNFSPKPTIIQSPSKENGYVVIKQLQIPDHPIGGFLSESTWKDCSIWDIKSVIENAGARKIWDNTFESISFLHALTQTSSIWHTKIKGAWPVNPRDYVCFHGQYSSAHHIDLLSTSCIGDSFQYKPLPKEVSGYIRATMDLMGWRLERVDAQTTSVKQILVTQFSTWVINYITSRFLVQSCAAVQSARDYLETFGAPPSLESLTWALLVNLKHDHERKNWRCEYTRRTESESKENERKADTISPSTISVIRLDKRRWASGSKNRYSVVIDPPPSRVTALEKVCDPYGVWVSIEHDEEFIIPLRGKILVLIKPDQVIEGDGECHLNVNGVTTFIKKEMRKESISTIKRSKQASFSTNFLKDEEKEISAPIVERSVPLKRQSTQISTAPTISEEEQAKIALDQLTVSPKDRAQAALTFLRQTDEQFGWTVISDNSKSGLRVSKKPGTKNINASSKKPVNSPLESPEDSTTLIVPDPYMIYKATKVIENFSVEEVTAVVTDIGNLRKMYDDTLEHIDLIRDIDPGSRVISQSVKAIFPFKNREIYATSCLAQESSTLPNSPNQRTLYMESSIPDFPIVNTKKTRGYLYMSGWILEAIDPYTTTTNYPIPSTRVTYVSALDLGNSVPSYISNLAANNWAPKKIQSVESYLKAKGPPPFISQPTSALSFANNTLSKIQAGDGIEWLAINTNYDKDKHHYKVNSRMKLENNTQKPTPKHTEEVIPSASSSASITSPLRRPSTHTLISPDVAARRGSLPMNALPKKRIIPITNHEVKEKPVIIPSRSIVFLQATFDLRAFTEGYEITAQLYDITDDHKRKNISGKLELSISEPSLSNLVDGKKKQIKHTVLIKAEGLSSPSTATYEFEFSLIPAREETIQIKSTRLTVSHVLGEDDDDKDKWKGIILINGVESEIGTDIILKSMGDEIEVESFSTHDDKPTTPLQENIEIEDNASSSSSGSEDQDMNEEPSLVLHHMGGGVVATALGNVSAGVNSFSARMMLPFRTRSTSFLLPGGNRELDSEERHNMEESSSHIISSEDEDEDEEYKRHGRFSKEEKRKISSTTLHEVRLLRRSRDTMRKGMFLLAICLGTAIVFALLMLQPMLERYYASFTASSTIESLDRSIENGVIRRLIQIPWFGGWDIQVIAVRRRDV